MGKLAAWAGVSGNPLTIATSAATSLGLALLMASSSFVANAQTIQTPASEEQRRRSQAEAQQRQQQLQAPNVDLQGPPPVEAADTLLLPAEPLCFAINRFVLDLPSQLSPASRLAGASDLPHDPFRFAQDYLNQYTGACIGKDGLNLIVKRLSALILSQGYSTTRVGIGEQDLASGTLKLTLVPGVIRAIRFSDPALYGTWKNAFPTGSDQLLNLRNLEQGLEQMKRLPSQDVDMQIVPTDAPGASDVVIDVKRGKPWKLSGTLDDSGAKGTGKLQAGINLAIENPLGLNDLFNIGLSTDADRKAGQRGTSGNNIYYAIPAGYWNLAVSGGSYDYHQKIAGNNQTFVSSGKSRNLEFKVAQLFQRDEAQKNSWQFKVGKRWSKAFVDDAEIVANQRNTTFAELAWVHKHYFGAAQLDLTLANRWGVSWFNGQGDRATRSTDDPTFRYTLQSIDATLAVPFKIIDQPLTYIGTLRGQTTRSRLHLTDQFSIGGRYTVRGFDGELTLTAERGFFTRHELAMSLAQSGQSAYIGLDYGQVYGPSVQDLIGNKLAGAAVGVRGDFFGMTYDVFSSWSLYKPQGFRTAAPAVGFNLTYQY
ncbi:ShlB/FhaC/HecB family hemolysin secretion/activation protein [Collimonas sp.]|jgi:hemolysin activation/secretion protein|uniref:ShlB/FhaC/HecB family hemolysin secretion/activation protein n=1 Tax=Collimonas sp. TaxID=1963772 RepID=UPI002C5604DE|nr:ShlB/FhaC/HecB family hemolysin secretion/activation protein [Collimonas sp.]HWW08433.1 ShlB/FhaC/HecB family hemolysin secretion/activation protein [Collimonas sp.]